MEKKKNKKLMFQIGIVIVPLCLLMLVLLAVTISRSTIEAYLQAQRSGMTAELEASFSAILGDDGYSHDEETESWIYDFIDANPAIIKEPVTEEQDELYNNIRSSGENIWSVEWLEKQPEEIQALCVREWLKDISDSAEYTTVRNKYDDVFLININEGNEGFVYFYFSEDHKLFSSGDTIKYDLRNHEALQNLIKNPDEQYTFEQVRDFPDPGSYNFICFKPVVLKGKMRAVMGIAYGWERLQSEMSSILWNGLLVGIGGMLVALVVILLILYKRVLSPMGRIKLSVDHFIQTRDMEGVVRELGEVKEANEIGTLSDNLSEMVTEIDHYTRENIKLAEERQRVETELTLASQIQNAMLSKDFPVHEAFELSASMTPAKEVGGDFYDFFFLDETHLALVIADVSGKGIPAALFMMMAKNMIKNYARSGLSPAAILKMTNQNVLENKDNTMFVTVWLGFYDITTGRITAANAGHEYPMIRKKGGAFELYKDRHGLVVGGFDIAVYTEYEMQLDAGDTLFLYTDGAAEATNSEDQMIGTDGVLDALNKDPGRSPGELIGQVADSIREFVGDAPQFDDLTMLAIRRTK